MRPSLKKRLLLVAGFILLPLFGLTLLFAINMLNPLARVFLVPFEVVNSTDENLVITPIGAQGPDGERRTLPISSSSWLYLLSSQRTEFSLPAGATLSLTYDCDDVQFTEIVCRRPDGSHVVLPTGLHPTEGQYRAPPVSRFEFADLTALQPATGQHMAAVRARSRKIKPYYILAGLGILSPLCFRAALRMKVPRPPAKAG
jgi:hypothetical protein